MMKVSKNGLVPVRVLEKFHAMGKDYYPAHNDSELGKYHEAEVAGFSRKQAAFIVRKGWGEYLEDTKGKKS